MNTDHSDATVDTSSPLSSKKREFAEDNDTIKGKCIERSKKKKKIVAVIAIAPTDVPGIDPTFQVDNPSTDAAAAVATADVSFKYPTFELDHPSTDEVAARAGVGMSIFSEATKIVHKEDTPEEQNDPHELALLGLLQDKIINKNGFVMRTLSQYRLHRNFKNVKSVTNHFNKLNTQLYPRKFDTHSRKALSKLSPQSPTKYSAEMKRTFFENDKLNDTLANDFQNEMMIPTAINFGFDLSEEQRSTDKRLQFSFTAESATHEVVCKLLSDQKLYNPEKEIISDVSLIIGGTAIQDPHGDHPRVFSFFGQNQVSHEINRKEYNEAMKCTYAQSSILSGFDDKPFKLAIPDCYLERDSTCSTRNMVKAKCSSDEFKQLNSSKFVCHNNNGIVFDMVTIEVPSEGCQFVGDFFHSGADNVTGCLTKDEEIAFNELVQEAELIMGRNKETKRYSELFECLKSANYLTKITRFFCKTIPIDHKDLVVPYQNIMALAVNVCQYDESYALADTKEDMKYLNQENLADPEVKRQLSRSTLADQYATDGAKKDQQNHPLKGTKKIQKKQTKDQTNDQTKSPSAKKDQQKDAKDPPTKKPQKEQTNDKTKSPSSKKDQQKANSSPAKKRSAKTPHSTKPVPKRYYPYVDNDKICLVMRNMNDFQSIEFGIGRARNVDSKLYINRKNHVINNHTRERGDAAKNLIEKDIPLFLTGTGKTKNVLANENAFSLYFDLDAYIESVRNDNDDGADYFEYALQDLSERVKFAVVPNRKCRVVPVDAVEELGILKTNKWKIDVGFDEWTELRQKSNGQLPLVQWMTIKQNEKTKELSVRANRKFVAGEVIALFWGDRLGNDEIPSKFAFENAYGIYDANRGFIGDGSPVYNMAVHIMRVSFDQKEFNARLSNDFLLRAVRDIEVKEKFVITYDTTTVWKPESGLVKSGKLFRV